VYEGILKDIRNAIRSGNYIFTDHALEEADADGLTTDDIVFVLLNGEIDSVYTEDIRGPRYVIRGSIESIEIDVVCRIRSDGKIVIVITVYVVD
jgi:hypothetical protein